MTIKEMARVKVGCNVAWCPLGWMRPFVVRVLRFDRVAGLATVRVFDRAARRKLATMDWVVNIKQLEVPGDSRKS